MTVTVGDPNDVFCALSDARRRHVLYYLLEHDDASLDELADVISGWLTVGRGMTTTPHRRNRIRTDLHHVHLPMLADFGFLEYDWESHHVELRDLSDEIQKLLDESLSVERARTTETPSPLRSQGG